MQVLPVELRNKLERTIIEARDVAESGAKAALEALAVHDREPFGHMSPEERKQRNHLRARARQLGDKQNSKGELEITHLVWECAYEHWHRMLFARFLAENDLLIEPEMGVAISLQECEELAKEEGKDLWILASEFAQSMLPQIFRPDDPILKLMFAREHRLKLEKLLDDLEPTIFNASDSLGWVYQFWQTKRKKEVNESGEKIGADELPAVTQLFTETYMVNFLIHNTLGAWWAGKVLAARPNLEKQAESEEEMRRAVALPNVTWDYLRFVRSDNGKGAWRPAAGTFDGWPNSVRELKILDPCCGSGHFLVSLLYHLAPMRMAQEGLSPKDAVDATLSDNLCGLEIDERCTQIAVFALALSAWKYPGTEGYRKLPAMQIACSGLAPNVKKEKWLALASGDGRIRSGLERLYDLFQDAPTLGSLIDCESAMDEPLFQAGFSEVYPLIGKILSAKTEDYEQHEIGVVARGIVDAAKIFSKKYHLVITNVPYLARTKQSTQLKNFCERYYPYSKTDLATVCLERSITNLFNNATLALVTSQNWRFQPTYKNLRKKLLLTMTWEFVAALGSRAFETISGEVVNVGLFILTQAKARNNHHLCYIDASVELNSKSKDICLKCENVSNISQRSQYQNPDSIITFHSIRGVPLLGEKAGSYQGIKTGDDPKLKRFFWEFPEIDKLWRRLQSTVEETTDYGGLEYLLSWQNEGRDIARLQGLSAWGKPGIAISQMSALPAALYVGEAYDSNITAIIPHDPNDLDALYAYAFSAEFAEQVRKVDKALKPTNSSFTKIPFDLNQWKEKSNKLKLGDHPKSDNPTQWVFKGAIEGSNQPLHVAVVRLLGYVWPEQPMDNSNRVPDSGGIVCLPAVRGEDSGAERLRALLVSIYGEDWSLNSEKQLISQADSNASDLEEYLRMEFFEQHCKLFHHRPFIWHIWDGRRRDGFHALVNYHKLTEEKGKGRQLLENLTYSYLGDWITRQKEGVKRGEGGAEDRLAAALELKKRIIAIIEGEPPFDIFVRWKPIEEQPTGWEPDINDGVRVNIRPFMAQDILGGRKGAGILRWKPNIKWGKDRGKEPSRPKEQYPWFWKDGEFTGDRVNDIHLSNEEKREARKRLKER